MYVCKISYLFIWYFFVILIIFILQLQITLQIYDVHNLW